MVNVPAVVDMTVSNIGGGDSEKTGQLDGCWHASSKSQGAIPMLLKSAAIITASEGGETR